MTSIYSTYADRYRRQTSAEALFFHSSTLAHVKGLRVLLPLLGLEFTDRSYIGTDPAGTFFYNDLDTAKTANKYISDNTRNPRDGQLIALIKFFYNDTLVAEFIGDDYFDVVKIAGMLNFSKAGFWRRSSAGSLVQACLRKYAGSNQVVLDISRAIRRTAIMSTGDSTLQSSGNWEIEGRFHYDDLNNIPKGTYVSYTNDRLVFYEDDWTGREFTGYFIPNGREDSPTLLGIGRTAELTLKGTVWQNN